MISIAYIEFSPFGHTSIFNWLSKFISRLACTVYVPVCRWVHAKQLPSHATPRPSPVKRRKPWAPSPPPTSSRYQPPGGPGQGQRRITVTWRPVVCRGRRKHLTFEARGRHGRRHGWWHCSNTETPLTLTPTDTDADRHCCVTPALRDARWWDWDAQPVTSLRELRPTELVQSQRASTALCCCLSHSPESPAAPPSLQRGRRTAGASLGPYTWAEKFESFERINSIRETNGNFDSCNSCKRLVPSRLHELHESKFPFVSRIEFIRSKHSNFLLMYTGSLGGGGGGGGCWPWPWRRRGSGHGRGSPRGCVILRRTAARPPPAMGAWRHNLFTQPS